MINMNWGVFVASIPLAASTSTGAASGVKRRRKKAVAPATEAMPQCASLFIDRTRPSATAEVVINRREAVSEHEQEAVDDPKIADQLYTVVKTDTDAMRLAKGAWNEMVNDLRAIVAARNTTVHGRDMFQFVKPDEDELRLYDALQWIYGFQEPMADEVIDGKLVKDHCVTFAQACDELGRDREVFRRVLARVVRPHFKELLRTIEQVAGPYFARDCELKIEDYVDVSDWRAH
jgi:hypothetical protein